MKQEQDKEKCWRCRKRPPVETTDGGNWCQKCVDEDKVIRREMERERLRVKSVTARKPSP